MASPLVESKLFVPRLRRGVIARPRLNARLSGGSQARLTLISAPAGFGKTTLLIGWLAATAAESRSTAWLSLDDGDRDPATFWTYVITALQQVLPGVGAGVLPLLQSPQPPIEPVLTALLNELSAIPHDIDVVLEDYHLADGPDVQAGMAFLIEHLPPQVHLIISTRADPLLPLARLRARGDLVEIRATDLRFTPDEVAAYLNVVAGLNLSAGDLAVLERRTEGWIAALQLAALSLQGRTDIGGFLAGFAGDDRYIVDYLMEEVLQRQTEQIRTFLLRTCVLDRLTGTLCDAVTGAGGGRATLEALDRANLFLVPLDDNRNWYRYHHLFAEMLQARLLDERPEDVADLHRRASQWYDQHSQPSPAVRHALAAGDFERAADLVELAIPALQRTRQEATIRGWLDVLPDDVVRKRPVLAVGLIGALMSRNEFAGVEERLQDVERALAPTGHERQIPGVPAQHIIVLDVAELPRLPGAIQMYRAALALIGGDLPATLRHARLAIDLAAPGDEVVRAGASGLSGLAYWTDGNLDAAHQAYSACAQGLQRAGHIADVLGCSIALADIRTAQGRLGDALRTYDQAVQLASKETDVLRGTADMFVGMSRVALLRRDLPAATEHLLRSQEFGEHIGLPQNPYRWRVAMAGIREAEGDLTGALTLLDEAQNVYVGDFSPDVRPIPALRARMLVTQGNVAPALGWVRDQGLTVDDDLSYLREFEHITLSRVLLARFLAGGGDGLDGVERLLQRLLPAAEAGGRIGSVIEILVVQALTHHAGGDTRNALAPLAEALTLAESEGYVQVFAGEGPPMTSLLTAVARQHPRWHYAHRVLAAGSESGTATSRDAGGHVTGPGVPLVDALSDRELDVLRLLATALSGPDIARRLIVSVNTMRTHTKSIYAKLGVNNRREAVHRAQELNLLTRT